MDTVKSSQRAVELKQAEENKRSAPLLKAALVFALLLGLSITWRWTPLSEWINLRTLVEWQSSVRYHPAALYLVIGAYVVGSLVLFPVTLLNVATVFTFGPVRGNFYALAGWLASAAVGYALGRALGDDLLKRLTGPRLDRLIDQAADHGFLTVLATRVVPVAPFTVVNLFAGASGIRFRDFMWASVVGRIPGMVLLTFAGLQLERFLRRPDVGSLALLALALVLLPLAAAWFSKRFKAAIRAGKSRPSRETNP